MVGTSERLASQLQTLLTGGDYELMAQLLHRASDRRQREGDAAGAIVLRAAIQICLACESVHQELKTQEHTRHALMNQENVMRQELHALLHLAVSSEETIAKSLPSAPQAEPEILQSKPKHRLKRLLHKLSRQKSQSTPDANVDSAIQTVAPNVPTSDEDVDSIQNDATFFIEEAIPPQQESMDASLLQVPPADDPSSTQQSTANRPALIIYCFGGFRVFQNDLAINSWKSHKGVAILKYLVTQTGKPISKEMLMDIFWPDADLESARRNLHQAVYSLRQALRRQDPDLEHIRYENDSYMLNPQMDLWIDYQEFERRVGNGRYLETNGRLAQALAEYGIAEGLYQGNFLEENLYDDWATRKREYLLSQYLSIAIRLIRHYRQQNENTAAIALCHKVINLDTSYEPAHRQLMTCFLAQGQRHLAVRQYQTCVQVLKDELGLEPDEKTVTLYQRINLSHQAN